MFRFSCTFLLGTSCCHTKPLFVLVFWKTQPDVFFLCVCILSDLPVTGGRLQPAGCGGCRPRCGDKLRAGWSCLSGCSSPRRPAPAALGSHEASADEAPSCQSEAESGRRQRACTGASGSPGRGRVWLILARTGASPPACWAPMSSSHFMGTSSPTHCRTTAG